MLRSVVLLFMLIVAVVLQGCIKVTTRVSVNPDGSGTVTERVLMNLSFMKSMLDSEKGEHKSRAADIPSHEDLKKSASAMGEGVRVKGVRNCTEGLFEGYEAVYAFRDVARITISGRPDERKEADSVSTAPVSGGDSKGRISFRFFKGFPAKLVIVLPEEKSLLEPAQQEERMTAPPAPDQQKLALAIIREAFRGTRMRLAVDIQGQIISTDAVCLDGSEVVLADVDFDKLLLEENQDAALLNLTGYGSSSGAIRDMLNRVPGVRGEPKQEVTVVFQ